MKKVIEILESGSTKLLVDNKDLVLNIVYDNKDDIDPYEFLKYLADYPSACVIIREFKVLDALLANLKDMKQESIYEVVNMSSTIVAIKRAKDLTRLTYLNHVINLYSSGMVISDTINKCMSYTQFSGFNTEFLILYGSQLETTYKYAMDRELLIILIIELLIVKNKISELVKNK